MGRNKEHQCLGQKKKPLYKRKRKGKKGFCMSRSKAESRTNQMQSISRFPAITSDALSSCDKPEIRKWAWVIKDNCQIGAGLSGRGGKKEWIVMVTFESWARSNGSAHGFSAHVVLCFLSILQIVFLKYTILLAPSLLFSPHIPSSALHPVRSQ